MAGTQQPNINPDDYLDTELGYDMPVGNEKEASSAEEEEVAREESHAYNPDDFSQGELGYEYEAGEEALE